MQRVGAHRMRPKRGGLTNSVECAKRLLCGVTTTGVDWSDRGRMRCAPTRCVVEIHGGWWNDLGYRRCQPRAIIAPTLAHFMTLHNIFAIGVPAYTNVQTDSTRWILLRCMKDGCTTLH